MIKEIKSIKLKEIDDEIEKISKETDESPELISLKDKREQFMSAKTLDDLGISLPDAVQILSEKNIPLVLGEEDKVVTKRDGEFQGLDDMVWVHVTRFAPTQSQIKSPKEAKATTSRSITLDGNRYDYDIPYMRDTVHGTINNEVNTSHGNLNCDECKYAILIPLSEIPKEKLKGTSADMYTQKGGPTITKGSYILCPKGEAEALRKECPKGNIIEYEGESVRGYAKAFLSTIGYRQVETDSYGFANMSLGLKEPYNSEDEKKFREIMKKNGIEIGIHFVSRESDAEDFYNYIEKEFAVYNIIKEEGLIENEQDLSRIITQLKKEGIIWRCDGEHSEGRTNGIYTEKNK